MCGIAGLIHFQGTPDQREAVLEHMLAAITHRGPDDQGVWCDSNSGTALGMRRLSIIDLSGGHQPIWNETGEVGIVFNGEIYNHGTLREELLATGRHTLRTRSDTEVLVHLYEEHGPDLFSRLQGMYALAIVDRRQNTILLARDPFGQKPLYFFSPADGCIAFASEPKSLKRVPGWTGGPCVDAYLDYAAWLSLPAPHTHWKGVEKFAPGQWRSINLGSGQIIREGRTTAVALGGRHDIANLDEAAELLHLALKDSVGRHLEADVPVGLLLSGGSDSLALGWVTSRLGGRRLHTFTAGFPGENSEFAPARRTADLLNSEHHEIMLDDDMLAREIERVLAHLDEPVGDPAAVAVLRICEEARKHVKVLLGGEGSDELFAGYTGRYGGSVDTMKKSVWRRKLLGLFPGKAVTSPSGALGRAWNRSRLSAGAELLLLRAEGVGPYLPWLQRHAPAVAARLRERAEHHATCISLPSGPLDAAQSLDLAWQLPESLLVKADRMSMAASVELRCPFLDPVVAGVAARLPANLRITPPDGPGKLALRHLLDRHVPQETGRPKVGFHLPVGRWLRGSLADDARSHLTAESSMFVRTFGMNAAREWWDSFLDGRASAHATYALWIYERWLKSQS